MLLPLLYNVSVAEEYFDRYGLTSASPSVDLGIQPLGYPSGVISAVMRHDRILKRTLAESTQPLATHPFKRGADMLALLADARLEAGLLGDLPTIGAASLGSVWIVGLVKQTSTAIVARDALQVSALAGQRIGYVEASSAHYTLLQGLGSVGLGETQVQLARVRQLNAQVIDCYEPRFKNVYYKRESCCGWAGLLSLRAAKTRSWISESREMPLTDWAA